MKYNDLQSRESEMYIEKVEETKNYIDFCNAVDNAITEYYRRGYVSIEKHKKVSDSFGDVYSKFTNKQFDFSTSLAFGNVISIMAKYNRITGNSFDLVSGIFKIISEMMNHE